MSRLAVNRNQDLRSDPFIHPLQFVPSGMPGDVYQCISVFNDLDTLLDELVLDLKDSLLVSWDHARRVDYRVAGRQCEIFHLVTGKFGECSARLTLTARAKDHQIFTRYVGVILFFTKSGKAFKVTQLCRDIDHALQ